MKIGLVTSAGGHLYQLLQLKQCWGERPHFWVSFDKTDVRSLLKRERIYYAHYPESRNAANFFRNLWMALVLLRRERPDVVISAGAGIAPPFFIAARIYGVHTIYIEPLDFIKEPTLTGRISYYLADLFLIQHPKQRRFFPGASYWGSSL